MKQSTRNENETRFKFITSIGGKLGESLVKLNKIVFGVIEAKPYQLDWENILKKYSDYYKTHGAVNIDSFAFDYVLGYSLLNKFGDNEPMKEAMYMQLEAELFAKRENGELEQAKTPAHTATA